jgi:hypothetical protein
MLLHMISECERGFCFRTSQYPYERSYRLLNGKGYSEKYLESIAQMFDIAHVLFRIATRFRLHTIPQTRVLSGPTYVSSLAQETPINRFISALWARKPPLKGSIQHHETVLTTIAPPIRASKWKHRNQVVESLEITWLESYPLVLSINLCGTAPLRPETLWREAQ